MRTIKVVTIRRNVTGSNEIELRLEESAFSDWYENYSSHTDIVSIKDEIVDWPPKSEGIEEIDYNSLNNLPTLPSQIGLTKVYSSGLKIGTLQDTNLEENIYKWEEALDTESLVYEQESGKFIAKLGVTIQVSAFIQVSEATANNRAMFLTLIQHSSKSEEIINSVKFSSVYVRDDNTAYNKGASGGAATFMLSAGDSIQVKTVRLYSADAVDDNPADLNLSQVCIEAWGIT